VSIAFITTRELSQQPARVLARVKNSGPQIITVNGRPTAYLVAASPLGIDADIDTLRGLRLRQALAAAQAEAPRAGTADLDSAAIEAEIAATRAARLSPAAKPARSSRKPTA
jgi:prevent-host-death family protein